MRKILIVGASIAVLRLNAQAPLSGDKLKPDKIYTTVEQEPEFPGGQVGFYKFLAKNLRYPAAAGNCNGGNIIDRIVIHFIVEKDGSLSGIGIEKLRCTVLENEVRKLLRTSPRWSPGKIHNKAVRVRYVIPIIIEPQNN